ncbi:MAG: M4 family metallopeptidase, partial [Bacteroidia bacterium]|nr:M4 family metallopeptidase [Bacteroidia bacterium]
INIMKRPSSFRWLLFPDFCSILLVSCKSTMEALRMSGALGSKKQKEQTDPPKFYNVDHSSHSDLPTIIDFFPDADLNKDNFPEWAAKEMKVDIRYLRSAESPDGTFHYFQQYHDDIPVYGAQYNFLMRDGKPVSAHGMLYQNIKIKARSKYSLDKLIKELKESHTKWWFRSADQSYILPFVDQGQTKMYLVYWIEAKLPSNGVEVNIYIDQATGKIVLIDETEMTLEDGKGIKTNGKEVNLGTQHTSDIDSEHGAYGDTKADGYRLMDEVRNLHTLSANDALEPEIGEDEWLNNGIFETFGRLYQGVGRDIIESDNSWEDISTAVDVHWGMQRSYDYFASAHSRQGWDGNNGYLAAIIDFDNRAAAFDTDGFLKFCNPRRRPGMLRAASALDIIGHEYAHAVNYSIVNLNSSGESGSIEEGIGDIFGVTIATINGEGNWLIGEEINPSKARNVKDPKSSGNPDTYEGENWSTSSLNSLLDEFEVENKNSKHQRSTIMSYWYYLLCEGGKGENDNEDYYDIKPIGMQSAADIVFRSLFRMHPAIDFEGIRKLTVDLARKKYGKCSKELKNVTNAWNAVGLGDPFCDCFEGSFVLMVKDGKKTHKATFYYKDDKSAIEILDEDGIPRRVVTSAGDPLRHVQGQPDIPASGPGGPWLRQMFQGKNMVLTNPPLPYLSRKAYVEQRNKLRTGKKMKVSGYTAFEYRFPDGTFWSTDEVCISLIDMSSHMAIIGPNAKKNNYRAFYGFPVQMNADGESYWIENIREYEVPDHIFSR